MNEARNKPRVFLSHSKRDIDFVQRLYEDLRHCQIDPWLDSEDIRHGQPWLDAIFESGIPTCDCVLVYLTPNSLESPVVKKEIGASLLAKLRDNHILFLPYVSNCNVREKLRPDIQTLQVLEWNDNNYHDVLPRVVAEVWRGFMERTIGTAVNAEKVKRLEAEAEIGRLKRERGGVFDEGEDRDFRHIWNALDRWEPLEISHEQSVAKETKTIGHLRVLVHVRSLLPFLAGPDFFEYNSHSQFTVFERRLKPILPLKQDQSQKIRIDIGSFADLTDTLLMFGLLERRERPKHERETRGFTGGPFRYSLGLRPYTCVWTHKMDRFKYWMSFNRILPTEVKWSTEQPAPAD